MTTTTTTAPAVWVGCLACYNSGRLVGEWVDAVDAADITPEAIHGRPTSHEELWVMDTDGLPISREMSPAEAAEWGALLAEVDEWQRDALAAWVASGDYVAEGRGDLPSLPDFEDRYAGEWDTFEDYAAELFDDLGYAAEMPEHLAPYFDTRAWARDLAYDYTTHPAPGGGVFVFRSL
jgi:antirestriction protein